MNVSVFDNINELVNQVVYITKNIGHCLSKVPDLIGDGLTSITDFTSYCPPFIVFIVMFLFGSGIILKGTHWGN